MRCKQCAVWLLVLTLLLAGTISSCRPRTAEPVPSPTPTEPSPTPTEPSLPTPSEPELEEIRAVCQDRSDKGLAVLRDSPDFDGLLYVENQVILTGAPDEIERITQRVELKQLTDGLVLDTGAAVRLYDTGGRTVQQVTCEINALRGVYGVWADPNYHLSPAQWIGGGSPWTQNGGWVGSKGGGQGRADAAEFQGQWAWGPRGIYLVDENGVRWGQERGEGTRIAVFDTSPFDDGKWTDKKCDRCSIQELVGGESILDASGMNLTVWHQIDLIPAPTCPGYSRITGLSLEDHNTGGKGQDISNHGLFVAGLAHAVAPESEIYLIRVLEDDGCGTLYQIVEGIRAFTKEIMASKGTLQGTVLNLSLGVHRAPPGVDFGLENDIVTLEQVLRDAHDQGAIIVAAAGNDSYKVDPGDQPREMELPAGYDFVLGVAASSGERVRGCFSNAGDVAAPGGDGNRQGEEGCEVPACSAGNPNPCLISMAYMAYRSDSKEPEPRYAYWVGTSFAAPLYSGLQALLLQRWTAFGDDPWPIEAYTCSSLEPDVLSNGIANWGKASGEGCP